LRPSAIFDLTGFVFWAESKRELDPMVFNFYLLFRRDKLERLLRLIYTRDVDLAILMNDAILK